MPRTLLISREHGRALKTYGVKQVRYRMKFSFIIGVVTVLFRFETGTADTRILNDLKYLEYLNDLDRRNVELDDIHKQWPFASINTHLDDEDRNVVPGHNDIDREKLRQAVDLARAEIANKHQQNYRERLLDKLEDGFKHMKETTDRVDQLSLSQYRRYKPVDQEMLEEARMYPDRNEEDARFAEEDNGFGDVDVKFNEDDEEITNSRFLPSRMIFPRITAMGERPMNYENTFRDESIEEEDPEEEEESIPNLRPTFPKAYFPRIAPVDLPVNFRLEELGIYDDQKDNNNNDMHHHEPEHYKFKEGEEFPQSISFHDVPVAEDPSEFAVGPTDPRFYRDVVEKPENTISITAKPQDTVHPYLMKSSYVSKSKINSRSDLHKQAESLPSDEHSSGPFSNKDVEVVPFQPDTRTESAGVYIIAIIAGISAAATVGLIAIGIGWYNLQKHMKNAEDTDYPSYGIVGPNKDYDKKDRDEAGDRRLAQSAQMYHYQHQKQQILAMGRNPQGHGSQSDTEEEEDEEGNYTVYECPGLASIEGPLEVKNPMFDDDQLATPSLTPSTMTNNTEDNK